MKRGLKVPTENLKIVIHLSSNRCPDEKGTERIKKAGKVPAFSEVATVAPMKRGLKGCSVIIAIRFFNQ